MTTTTTTTAPGAVARHTVEPLTVALVAAGAMLIAVLASILPAWRAARLHPVEALRYE